MIDIVRADAGDFGALAQMRALLWPDTQTDEQLAELVEAGIADNAIAFIARLPSGEVAGFAEASIRHDYVNGCETAPVAFVEAVYVHEACRRRGVATALCTAITQWGREQGCSELGSDADLANLTSHAFHRRLGFEERERVVFFRKRL